MISAIDIAVPPISLPLTAQSVRNDRYPLNDNGTRSSRRCIPVPYVHNRNSTFGSPNTFSPIDIVVPRTPNSRHQNPSKELYIDDTDVVPSHRDVASAFDKSVIEIRRLAVEKLVSAIDMAVPPIPTLRIHQTICISTNGTRYEVVETSARGSIGP
jgi:hypothetical protein